MNRNFDFSIATLGSPKVQSPLALSTRMNDFIANYVPESKKIVFNPYFEAGKSYTFDNKHLLEVAGPRQKIFFDPAKVKAGIITCGGLCPGLNDVIRSIVLTLWYRYGCRNIQGIKFGYRGLLPEYGITPMELNPDVVSDIHRKGGTILGSSRGGGNRTEEIVDTMESMNLNMLFTIGGDGTQRGAYDITQEVEKRKLKVAVVGIPKTIDNDLSFIERSFGFETAVSKAVESVSGAHVEASDAVNGVGIVKVMGRQSGFIAAHTALAMNDVNYVLVPEVPFELDGAKGLFAHLEKRLETRNHAVILAAEGAGQSFFSTEGTDASGNKKLGDIGVYLKAKIKAHFQELGKEINIKYIDPSYIIRSAPANPNDSIYCARLGTNAAHAAMAGKTGLLMGLINNHLVHIPIKTAVSKRNSVDPESSLWRDVVECTGQPPLMVNG